MHSIYLKASEIKDILITFKEMYLYDGILDITKHYDARDILNDKLSLNGFYVAMIAKNWEAFKHKEYASKIFSQIFG